jgi:hypothetical protein
MDMSGRRSKRLEDIQAVACMILRGLEGWAQEHKPSEEALGQLVYHITSAFQNQKGVILGTATPREELRAKLKPHRPIVEGLSVVLEDPTAEERP